jgi:hypothetical protein
MSRSCAILGEEEGVKINRLLCQSWQRATSFVATLEEDLIVDCTPRLFSRQRTRLTGGERVSYPAFHFGAESTEASLWVALGLYNAVRIYKL